MWSKELIELSRECLNYDNTSVKSQKGDFGILNVDNHNKIWTITLLTENTRNLNLTFHSVEEIIDVGWAVD
jgi:predicted oxidoreductase (fatty acid repression mutant protein)